MTFSHLPPGKHTADDIVRALEKCQTVVVDTSRLGEEAELLIGSIVASKLFYSYKKSKGKGQLDEKPPVGVVIEEAPRVLAEDKIEQGDNIYSRIAREGRKFKVGLIAITQTGERNPNNHPHKHEHKDNPGKRDGERTRRNNQQRRSGSLGRGQDNRVPGQGGSDSEQHIREVCSSDLHAEIRGFCREEEKEQQGRRL